MQERRERERPMRRENIPKPPTTDEIKKHLKKDAIEHPTTSFPLVIAVLSVIYLFFFAPFIGGGLAAFVVAIASGLTAVFSGGWRWFIKGKKYLEQKTRELADLQEEERKELVTTDLVTKKTKLESGFGQISCEEGLKELRELTNEYRELLEFLSRGTESRLISNDQIFGLASETYGQGLNMLSCALESLRVIRSAGIEGLAEEIADIEKEIERLRRQGPGQARMITIKEETLASHKERIAKAKELELNAARFFSQSDKCEAVLQQTRLDLNMLGVDESEEKAKQVTERLQRIIEFAKGVEQELRRVEGLNA